MGELCLRSVSHRSTVSVANGEAGMPHPCTHAGGGGCCHTSVWNVLPHTALDAEGKTDWFIIYIQS